MPDKFTSLLAACVVTGLTVAAPSALLAKERPITVTAKSPGVPVRYVSYRDLDLALLADEKILVGRVRLAAKQVCDQSTRGDPALGGLILGCRSEAEQGARPQIERAVARARDIASNGWSGIAPVAIAVTIR